MAERTKEKTQHSPHISLYDPDPLRELAKMMVATGVQPKRDPGSRAELLLGLYHLKAQHEMRER